MNKIKTHYYIDVILTSFIWGLIISILLFYYLTKTKFSFENKIGLNDIINIIMAIFLAIIIPKSIGKILDNKKNAKQLCIESLADLNNNSIKILNEIDGIVLKNENKIFKINNDDNNNKILLMFKRIGTNINSLITIIEKEFGKLDNKELFDEYIIFYKVTTENIKNKKFTFNKIYQNNVFKSFINFENKINELKFSINNK